MPLDPTRWPACLQGGGETGELVRATDWSQTPLGPIERWPISLKNTVGMLLHSRQPMFLWWGPELIQIYNDAYIPSFGAGKHPAAMGQRGRECWQEIWPIIGPQIDAVMHEGRASWNEDHLVPIWRNGRIEEVYWTYGYSPVYDEREPVAGTLVVCTETTARVLAERRMRTLRALDEGAFLAFDRNGVRSALASAIGEARADVPFALLSDAAAGDELPYEQAVNIGGAALADLRARCEAALAADPGTVRTLAIAPLQPADPPWPEPVTQVLLMPLAASPQRAAGSFVAFGLSPRLPFDASYREHLLQLAEHVALAQARVAARVAMQRSLDERATLLRDLETANRAKDEFLAMLGHELRNPLAPIVTALELMRSQGGEPPREQEIIERQVSHLVRLVDDLLDVAKITRGKVELRRGTVEIAHVVADAVEIASVLIETRRHRLQVEVPDGLRWYGDRMRMAQVVSNLLTNAARYTEPGGLIRVSAEREGAQIAIRVSDDGIGIAPDVLPHVFDMFVQGKRSEGRAEGGLGLGLALVRNLVAMHGGSVHAESEGLGKGSTFVIRLPISVEAERLTASAGDAAASARPQERLANVQRRRVLLVDDNVDAADLLGTLLRRAGHWVTVVNDPAAAIESLPHTLPEVAVLDIGLPVLDGYELARRLRALPAGRSCRFIALTGYGQDGDRARSRAAGFDHHLVKPVDVDELLQLLA